MSSSAQLAAGDFARLAGEGALGLYGENFLVSGSDALPDAVRARYPGLAKWRGIAGLKTALRSLAGIDANLPVWLFQRSALLMRRAARMIVERCDRVLVTDTAWPPFLTILHRACRRAGRELVRVRIRDDILIGGVTSDEITSRLCEQFRHRRCDGVFLPAVSNEGIKLPTRRITEQLASQSTLRFVLVDGAQEFGHAPPSLDGDWCDLYLAGCHKWLCAYQPMAIALAGRTTSAQWIAQLMRRAGRVTNNGDPLLHFTQQLETDDLDGVSETVNIAPIFSCQGALQDVPESEQARAEFFQQCLANAAEAAEAAARAGWRPLLPHADFRSGILLLQPEREQARVRPTSVLRDIFRKFGIVVTTYDKGLVRLSMPGRTWLTSELDQLAEALRYAA